MQPRASQVNMMLLRADRMRVACSISHNTAAALNDPRGSTALMMHSTVKEISCEHTTSETFMLCSLYSSLSCHCRTIGYADLKGKSFKIYIRASIGNNCKRISYIWALGYFMMANRYSVHVSCESGRASIFVTLQRLRHYQHLCETLGNIKIIFSGLAFEYVYCEYIITQ